MPCIKDQSTVDKIAEVFCSNGRNREKAMVEVGYTPRYARSWCGQLWANPRLIAAIERIDSESQARSGYDYDESMKRKQIILDAMQDKLADGNLDAARTAGPYLKQMDNISGLEQQNIHTTATPAPERTEAEQAAYDAAAREYKLRLA